MRKVKTEMSRILVTGGAGFIGSNFVRMLVQGTLGEKKNIVVLDSLTYAGNLSNLSELTGQSNFQFIQGDICDSKLLSTIIEDVDYIVNFAAESHVDRSILNSSNFLHTNIFGVHNLLESVRNSARKIRLLQVSTDEIYGSISEGSWTEESPILPNSPYSATKASGELICRAYHKTYELDVVITRCSNNYGPYHFPEKLIPLFITNLMEKKKLPIYGTGNNVRDWLHVDDHCRGIHAALFKGKAGEIYNIGGGQELTNIEISHLILEAMGADESSIEFVEDRKGHDFRYSVNWSKINQELGYSPQVKFKDGLRETINWYRNNRDWWEPLKKRAGL